MNLYNLIKKIKITKKFNMLCKMGKNIMIYSTAACNLDQGGEIIIGDNCQIYGYIKSGCGGRILIGNNSYVGPKTIIGACKLIDIGKCCIISNHVRIYDNNNHPTSPKKREQMSLGGFHSDLWKWDKSDSSLIHIDDNVWIGEYSTILKGVSIGKGSIVATGAVVTKDVPPYTIVAGNPAKVVKELNHDKE